jgi:hypothetical protein
LPSNLGQSWCRFETFHRVRCCWTISCPP